MKGYCKCGVVIDEVQFSQFKMCPKCYVENVMKEPWDCVHRNKKKCTKNRKYCGDYAQFGLTCYKRFDVIDV